MRVASEWRTHNGMRVRPERGGKTQVLFLYDVVGSCASLAEHAAAMPNRVHPMAKNALVVTAPASTDHPGDPLRISGACVAMAGTTKASNHQSPATRRVPMNAVR